MSAELLQRDYEFILDTVYRVNMTDSVELYALEALDCICTLIPCDQGTFFPFDEERGFYGAYSVGDKPLLFDEFLAGGFENETIFKFMSVKTHPYAFRDSDLIPEEVLLGSRLYNEIYANQGIHWPLRIELIYGNGLIGQFALFNRKETGDFSSKDVHIGNLLASHLTLKLHELQCAESGSGLPGSSIAGLSKYGLTQRETEVIGLISAGMLDVEIAEKLFISVSTVKKHVYNSYAKIGVNNRTQLMALLK